MYKYLRKKTKTYETKAAADTQKAVLEATKEFFTIETSEDGKTVTTQKEVTSKDFVEDVDKSVTTKIHFCDHNKEGKSTMGGCKTKGIDKAILFAKEYEDAQGDDEQ